MKRSVSAYLFASVAFVAAPSLVSAQEYCVVCTEPNAMYRCQIDQAQAGAAQSMQVACITQLAQQSGHAQCSVKRNVTVFDCDAPVKVISLGAATAVPPPPQLTAPIVAPVTPANPNEPPKTLVEAAQRANEASKKQWQETGTKLKEAGDATGTFFKRTLTCVGSLFTKCQ